MVLSNPPSSLTFHLDFLNFTYKFTWFVLTYSFGKLFGKLSVADKVFNLKIEDEAWLERTSILNQKSTAGRWQNTMWSSRQTFRKELDKRTCRSLQVEDSNKCFSFPAWCLRSPRTKSHFRKIQTPRRYWQVLIANHKNTRAPELSSVVLPTPP